MRRKTLSITFVTVTLFVILLAMSVSAESMLEISEVTVKVDGDKQSADENGGSIDVQPDSTLSLKIKAENKYDRNTDGGEIENIEILGVLEEIDDGDDIEAEGSDFDLRPNNDKTLTLEFKIPLRLETDGTYKLLLTAEGEDKNGTTHTAEVEFDVEVDKENHELRFLRKELSPTELSCTRSTVLFVGIINTGEDDENEVEFIVDASELGYNKRLNVELSEDIDSDDNEFTFSDTIQVSSSVEPGTYPVLVKTLYYDGKRTLEDTLNLVVKECASSHSTSTKESQSTGTTSRTTTTSSSTRETEEQQPIRTTTSSTSRNSQPQSSVEVTTQPGTTTSSSYIKPTTVAATSRTLYTKQSWWDENKWLVMVLGTNLLLVAAGIIVIAAVLSRRK
jgi:hypothetical protein